MNSRTKKIMAFAQSAASVDSSTSDLKLKSLVDNNLLGDGKSDRNQLEPLTDSEMSNICKENSILVLNNCNGNTNHPAPFQESNKDVSGTVYASRLTNPTTLSLRKISDIPCHKNSENHSNYSSFSESDDDSIKDPDFMDVDETSSEDELITTDTSLNNIRNETNLVNSPKKKGKKRVRNQSSWKKEKAKLLRNLGKEYKSSSKSEKIITERKMGPACNDKCILNCSKKISEEQRIAIFDTYWQLGKLERQRSFLASCIQELQLKYRRVSTQKEPRRPNSAFYLYNKDMRIRVCKTFFRNTLGISDRPIRTIIAKKGDGFLSEDQRGRHNNHVKLSEEIRQSVVNHINSIPRIESHYLRASTSREYIDGGLTIAEMHRHYEQERTAINKKSASYAIYSNIFNTEFNIGFFKPKKDLCDLCEAYKNAEGKTKEDLEESYKLHHEEKLLSREEKDHDKKTEANVILATYDLQAVLPSPIGQSSVFYYKSKLNSYNLTICELKNDNTLCYFWHEGEGNRGTNEIGTCVYTFLEEISNKANNDDQMPEVIFYTDNCGGQQKNKFMLTMYLYAVKTLQIKAITHKFLIRGHTQNEGDCCHSVIEKAVARAKKAGPIYIPDQYISIIRTAKKKGNPFRVIEMSHSDFYDFKILPDEIGNNFSNNTVNEIFKINESKLLRVEKASPDKFFYKTSYKDVDWKSVQVYSERPRARKVKECVSLKKAYKSKFPLSDNKKKDISTLLKTSIIPKYYESFFNNYI